MAHIVVIPYEIASKLYPTFELARRLQAAGHRVTFMGKLEMQPKVENAGFDFVRHNDDAKARRKSPSGAAAKIREWLSDIPRSRQRIQEGVAALRMGGFRETVDELMPHLLLIDVESHEYIIAAQQTGVPVALLSTFISMFKQPGVPPPHLPITPGVGWVGSPAGIEFAWFRYRVSKWLRHRRLWLRGAGADDVAILRAFARQVGFPFQSEVDFGQWLFPFSYRSLPVLSLNAAELDFPHKAHPNFHYIGTMIARAPDDPYASMGAADAERLRTILTQHQNADSDRKLIYCAFGAFFQGDDTSFWQQVAGAVSAHPEWDVVFGLGGRLNADALVNIPTNVHAFRWVPQPYVLEHADCAVIHGGITTINECILAGVPMVVYPFDTTDQHGSAVRVGYHKLGVVADRNTDDAGAIRQHIEHVLTDADIATHIRQMRAQFRDYPDPNLWITQNLVRTAEPQPTHDLPES